jgi:hypothetical protein
VVEVAFVANEDFDSVGGTDTFNRFVVVRQTIERSRHVDCIDNDNDVSAIHEVLSYLLLSRLASRIPNFKFDLPVCVWDI